MSSKKRRAEGRTDILDDGVERPPFLPEALEEDDEPEETAQQPTAPDCYDLNGQMAHFEKLEADTSNMEGVDTPVG